MDSRLYELWKELFGEEMHGLSPSEVEQYHNNIMAHSRVIPGYNYFDELEKEKKYYFVARYTKPKKIKALKEDVTCVVHIQKPCSSYWEALREALYWCASRQDYVVQKVGFE